MEVTIRNLHGIEKDSIVSIHTGSKHAQFLKYPAAQPFEFPILPLNANPFNIDLLRPISSCRLNIVPFSKEDVYSVLFPTEAGRPTMSMELQIKGVPQMCNAETAQQDTDFFSMNDIGQADMAAAKSYFEKFHVLGCVKQMLQYVAREQPEDPYMFMARYLHNASKRKQEGVPVPEPEPHAPMTPDGDYGKASVMATIARQNQRLDAENERLRDQIDTLHKLCPTPNPALELASLGPATFLPEGLHQQELEGKNRQLRVEHKELQRTLDEFCEGFSDLADKLTVGVSLTAAQLDTQDQVEMELEATNARLEIENRKLEEELTALRMAEDGEVPPMNGT